MARRRAYGLSRGRGCAKVAEGWEFGKLAAAFGGANGELRALGDDVTMLRMGLESDLQPVAEARVD